MSEDPYSIAERPGRRAARVAAITRACWIGVLVLTGVFHVLRGVPVDAAIFFGAALVVTLESLGWLRIPLSARADRTLGARPLVAGLLIAACVAVLALSPQYGGADTAVVVGLGLVLLPVGWADRAVPSPDRMAPARPQIRRAAIAWAAIVAAGCVWEIAAFFLGRGSPAAQTQFPALSDLVDPLLAAPLGRALLVALWLLGGYALIRRGQRR